MLFDLELVLRAETLFPEPALEPELPVLPPSRLLTPLGTAPTPISSCSFWRCVYLTLIFVIIGVAFPLPYKLDLKFDVSS